MTEEQPPLLSWGVKRLDELRERSRGLQLGTLPGASVRLSKFTKKQLQRKVKLVPGMRRSGLRLKKAKPKVAWQTKRAAARRNQRKHYASARRRWIEYRQKHKEMWEVSWEEWDELWYLLGTPSVAIGRYYLDLPYTRYNLYIEDAKTGKKLYEGAEELMRECGWCI